MTLKDINLKLEVEESGKNAIENAYLKAKAYYEATGIASIGMDNNLFIEELPEEKQPGTYVRRVGGKEPKQYTWAKDHFCFVDKPCEIRTPGYPLDSISIMPEYNKYFVELTQEEKNRNINNEDDVIDFIVGSLN